MSTYYECRFKDLKLDLGDRPDIVKWLKQVKEEKLDTLNLPDGMIKNSRCDFLDNTFTDNLKKNIDISNVNDVLLDVCIGNKNKDNDIENLILLLKPYIKSGSIFLYNEDITREVDIKETSDIYLEFKNIKESLVEYKNCIEDYNLDNLTNEEDVSDEKYDWCDGSYYGDYLYELLHCGLND